MRTRRFVCLTGMMYVRCTSVRCTVTVRTGGADTRSEMGHGAVVSAQSSRTVEATPAAPSGRAIEGRIMAKDHTTGSVPRGT